MRALGRAGCSSGRAGGARPSLSPRRSWRGASRPGTQALARRPPEAREGFPSPASIPAREGPREEASGAGTRRRRARHRCPRSAGPLEHLTRGLSWAAPPAPRPSLPVGPAHPEDEVEKHQHGLGGGDAALTHRAGGPLGPCSASGRRSPSEAAMAAPLHWELHCLRGAHRSPQCRRAAPAPASTSLLRAAAADPQAPRAAPRQPSPAPDSFSQSLPRQLQRGHAS